MGDGEEGGKSLWATSGASLVQRGQSQTALLLLYL